jgi:acylphosphatase
MKTVQTLVRIEGKVQGVWYRAWTEEQAIQRGLCGWVRNRLDGSVEAFFRGLESAIEEMLTACLDGPQNAVVSAIKPQEQSDSPISDSEHAAALQGFIRLPTA